MSTKFHHLRVPGNLTVFAYFTGQSDQVLNQIPGLLSFEIALRKARELQAYVDVVGSCTGMVHLHIVGVLIMNGVRLLLPKVVPFEYYCWLVSFIPCWICHCLNGM